MWECKRFSARRLLREFPNKNWKRQMLDDFLQRLRTTGSIERMAGSARPQSSRTADNVAAVDELVQSQEGQPQTHLSTRQISRNLRLPRMTVRCIIRDDLRLKCMKRKRVQELTTANRDARLVRAEQPLQHFSEAYTCFVVFMDEETFMILAPSNPKNDRLYVDRSVSEKQVAADRL